MGSKQKTRGKNGRFKSKASKPRALPVYQAVFDTPELMEAILIHVPMKDLLLSQRVSKQWKGTTESSLKLQRALFFKPAAEGPVSWIDWRLEHRGWYTKPDSKLSFGPVTPDLPLEERPEPYTTHWGKDRDDFGQYSIFVNPLLAKAFPVLTRSGIDKPDEEKDLPKAFLDPRASWRKMHFTQPTIEIMAVSSFSAEGDTFAGWSQTECAASDGRQEFEMEGLLEFLNRRNEPSWIEGREMWRRWESGLDLGKLLVKQDH